MDSILRGETGNIRQGRASRETQRKAKGSARTHKTPSWSRRSHAYQRKQVGAKSGHALSYSAKGAPPQRTSLAQRKPKGAAHTQHLLSAHALTQNGPAYK